MILEAKTAILNSGDFLSANEVAKLAGVSAVNPTLQPNKWERDQDIFAIRQGREDEDVTKLADHHSAEPDCCRQADLH